jgi:hypothetical protein
MEEKDELFKSVEEKFKLITRYRNRVRLLERRRSVLKRKLRETMESQEHSLNYALKNAQKIQKRIHRFSEDIREQRYWQNFWWKNLKYEDKCRYRYLSNNESIPEIKTQAEYESDQGKSVVGEAPLNRNSIFVTRDRAFELIKGLTDFLETGAESIIIAE